MKKLIIASALVLMSGAAFAQATMLDKAGDPTSNGSSIGVQSSQVTGNGDWVSGNGTQDGTYGAGDQTTTPGSRADAVHQSNDFSHAGGNGNGNGNRGGHR